MKPQPRFAIVTTTRGQGRCVGFIDGGLAACDKSNVRGTTVHYTLAQPKGHAAKSPKSLEVWMPGGPSLPS
ncbi:hypothetical protein [Glaciimonas sp. PAMC28666]|uniref:hypothetical protein n=1 Tax=Glaciimonas sp. PAMC28666 TaxID=2807626 RepID=UPI0019669C71|nr:hypothetical protein [Glaciimonas sp. PAMC28666]QRX83282.1 hypothetical protein JQN73_03105 [Glaciimonas sp. PAMC28666]